MFSSFQLDNLSFDAERNNKPSSRKANAHLQDLVGENIPLTFYALFNSGCQPQLIFTSEPQKEDSLSASMKNFLRGILNLFQVRQIPEIILF